MVEIFESPRQQFGISTFNNTLVSFLEENEIDCIINYSQDAFSNNGTYIYSSREQMYSQVTCLSGKHIFVCHGMTNENFTPPKDFKFDMILTLSGKQFRYYVKHGYKNVKQFTQIVDDEFWNIKSKPTGGILVIDPRNSGFYINQVHQSLTGCALLSVRSIVDMLSPEDLREEIANNSVVLASGRTAIESILCRRPTIIMGHNGGDGLVTADNFEKMLENNFSVLSKKYPIDLSLEIGNAFDMSFKDLDLIRQLAVDACGKSLVDVNEFSW